MYIVINNINEVPVPRRQGSVISVELLQKISTAYFKQRKHCILILYMEISIFKNLRNLFTSHNTVASKTEDDNSNYKERKYQQRFFVFGVEAVLEG